MVKPGESGGVSRRSPLVGRSDELSSVLAFCAVDAGGSILITGDAGIGKSRLLDEIGERRAAAHVTVLRGHAVRGGGPFRPLVEALVRVAPRTLAVDDRLRPYAAALGRLLPGWPVPDGPVGGRLVDPVVELGEAVLELVAVIAGDGRLLVLLDDLQWADRDTLVLLEYLDGGLANRPVHMVMAARDDESGPAELDVLRRRLPAVRLGRLNGEHVAGLARTCAAAPVSNDVVEFLVEAADGLPLLVEELFAGLVGAGRIRLDGMGWHSAGPFVARVHGAFAAVVQQRLDGLTAQARSLVQTAALLGDGLDWSLLATASGTQGEGLAADVRAAVAAGLLVSDRDGDGGLGWRHALVRDAVLSGLAPPERSAMGVRVVERLLADRAGLRGDRLATTAELCRGAGLLERAAELLLTQGREQVGAGALAAAGDSLAEAAALAAAGTDLAGEVAVERVGALALGARVDDAIAIGDAAMPGLSDPRRRELALQLARACVAAERWDSAQSYLDVVDAEVPERFAVAAHVALGRHDRDAALRWAEMAIEIGERVDRPETVCEALEITGRALRRSDPDASRAAFETGEQLAARRGLVPWRIRALAEVGTHDLLGSGAVERLVEARRLASEAGMLGTAVILDLQIGAASTSVDGHVGTLPLFRRCAEQSERLRLPGPRAQALMFVGRGLFWADDDELRALPEETARLSPIHAVSAQAATRGFEAWLGHDAVGGAALLDEGVAPLRSSAVSNPAPLWGHWALLATVARPDDHSSVEELRRSDVLVQSANRAALHFADAVIATRAGHLARAGSLLEAGDAELGHKRHELLFQRSLMVTPDGPAAPFVVESLLREALARWEPAGEVRLARWCRETMRTLGLSVPRPGRDRVEVPARLRAIGVTGRELEVLRLVGSGASNADVAARLHLSPRTVETHVSSLLTKTGAAGRGALAEWSAP